MAAYVCIIKRIQHKRAFQDLICWYLFTNALVDACASRKQQENATLQ